jgi:hypothetical protein
MTLPVIAGQWGVVSQPGQSIGAALWRQPITGKTITAVKGLVQTEKVFDWSGGAFDSQTGRLYCIAGGGHSSSASNEADLFVVSDGLWRMLRGPSVDLIPSRYNPTQPSLPYYSDPTGLYGPPGNLIYASRHNYQGQVYHAGKIVQFSGVRWWDGSGCGPLSWETDAVTGICAAGDNFMAGWPGGTTPNTACSSCLDTLHDRVIFCSNGRLRSYDHRLPAGQKVRIIDDGQENSNQYIYVSLLHDPQRDRVVGFGPLSPTVNCVVWEAVANGKYQRRVQTLAAPYNAQYSLGNAPLVARDPISGVYWIHPSGGRTLYAMNPDTFAITNITPTVGVTPDSPEIAGVGFNGTYNRGGYSIPDDLLVVVHRVAGAVFAYRPLRPSADTIPPGIPEWESVETAVQDVP